MELILIIGTFVTAAAITWVVALKLSGRDDRTANEKAFDAKLESIQAWLDSTK